MPGNPDMWELGRVVGDNDDDLREHERSRARVALSPYPLSASTASSAPMCGCSAVGAHSA